jgi:hypothetical protein
MGGGDDAGMDADDDGHRRVRRHRRRQRQLLHAALRSQLGYTQQRSALQFERP